MLLTILTDDLSDTVFIFPVVLFNIVYFLMLFFIVRTIIRAVRKASGKYGGAGGGTVRGSYGCVLRSGGVDSEVGDCHILYRGVGHNRRRNTVYVTLMFHNHGKRPRSPEEVFKVVCQQSYTTLGLADYARNRKDAKNRITRVRDGAVMNVEYDFLLLSTTDPVTITVYDKMYGNEIGKLEVGL